MYLHITSGVIVSIICVMLKADLQQMTITAQYQT